MLAEPTVDCYDLVLYVAGTSPRMRQAYANLTTICSCHLGGRCRIRVVDLLRHPECAKSQQIVVVPTLVWKSSSAVHTIVGDFSNHQKVLFGLEIRPS